MADLDANMERDLGAVMQRCFQVATCKFCGEQIAFKERIAYDADGQHEHRCISRSMQIDCRHCRQPIFFTNRKPFNPDGTAHRCLSRGAPFSEAENNLMDLFCTREGGSHG